MVGIGKELVQKCHLTLNICVPMFKAQLKEYYWLLFHPDLHDGSEAVTPVLFSCEFWTIACGQDGKRFAKQFGNLRKEERDSIREKMKELVCGEAAVYDTSDDGGNKPHIMINMNALLRKWPLSPTKKKANEDLRQSAQPYLIARLFRLENWKHERKVYKQRSKIWGKELTILENAYIRMEAIKTNWREEALALRAKLKVEKEKNIADRNSRRQTKRKLDRVTTNMIPEASARTIIKKEVNLQGINGEKMTTQTGAKLTSLESENFQEGIYIGDTRWFILPKKSLALPKSDLGNLVDQSLPTQTILPYEPLPTTDLAKAQLEGWIEEARGDLTSDVGGKTYIIVALVEDYGNAEHPLLMDDYVEDKKDKTLYLAYCASVTVTDVTKNCPQIHIAFGRKTINIINMNIDYEYAFFGKQMHKKFNHFIDIFLKTKFKLTSKSIFRSNGDNFLCVLSTTTGYGREFGSCAYNLGLNVSETKVMFDIIQIYDTDSRLAFIASLKSKKFRKNTRRDLNQIKELQQVWEGENEEYIAKDRKEEKEKLEELQEKLQEELKTKKRPCPFDDVQNAPPIKKLRRSNRHKY